MFWYWLVSANYVLLIYLYSTLKNGVYLHRQSEKQDTQEDNITGHMDSQAKHGANWDKEKYLVMQNKIR